MKIYLWVNNMKNDGEELFASVTIILFFVIMFLCVSPGTQEDAYNKEVQKYNKYVEAQNYNIGDTFIIIYNEDTKVVNLAIKDMEEKGYKKLSITPVSRKTGFTSSAIEYMVEYQKIK